MDKRIYAPKNIAQLRVLAKSEHITFSGLRHSFTTNALKEGAGIALIKTDKIREFHTTLKTTHTCVVGLSTTINQLMNLTSTEIPYPLLEACFFNGYNPDMWHINLMEAIFSYHSPPYIRLFLAMVDAQVQCMKDKSFVWLSFRDLVNDSCVIHIDEMIPVKIKFDLFNNTRHYLNTHSHLDYSYKYPLFYTPIIMGQIDINEQSEINDIYFLYADEKEVIQDFSYFKKAKDYTYPLRQSELVKVWSGYNFKDIPLECVEHIKQALTTLLSPSFI